MSLPTPRQTFSNPVIPFSGTILGGLQTGEMILIQGSVLHKADRFQVDLTCGSSVKPRADVAFHFNPRINKSMVVCNSLIGERWGREEHLQRTPFSAGAAFELLILIQKDCYKVAVNGAHLLEYKHRIDLNRVNSIFVSGKVKVENVGVLPPQSHTQSIPFRADLKGGLKVGWSIIIKGTTNHTAQSLCVNLCVGGASSDLAFHLNPRLNKGVLVRNSFLSGCWGEEETTLPSDFPFTAGQYFEVIIKCEASCFRVAVNGIHQFEYRHRVTELGRITQVEVLGDISLLDLQTLTTSLPGGGASALSNQH
ncbi:galectin-8-like [Gouania willdenowi]|uniref:galectin-8-like n=1 Tax=Gouania willdenowi TaxID=441366 RepID=UPI0010557516|nr:galectin-8-like [Gouania willdenowi]